MTMFKRGALAIAIAVAMGTGANAAGGAASDASMLTASGEDVIRLAQADEVLGLGGASPLPGGASSLQETFQDWIVACGQATDASGAPGKRCAMVQQQYDGQTRQRVIAVELTPKGDTVEALLMLPFGIDLASGVTLQVDDGAVGSPLPFRTCFPSGCLVPFVPDADLLAALRKGGALKVAAVPDGGGQIAFAISLNGFSAAYNRIVELSR